MDAPSFLKAMNKTLLIPEEAIAKKVNEIAHLLNQEYAKKELVLVGILKGSICLIADLIRHLEISFRLEFVQAASYGMGGTHQKELELIGFDRLDLSDKEVLLIDDIYDSGKTLSAAFHILETKHPKSLETLVLLKKKVSHKGDILPTYVCFDIENHFVVGYGLDYKEKFRGLEAIYTI